jgi:hypothetical protein
VGPETQAALASGTRFQAEKKLAAAVVKSPERFVDDSPTQPTSKDQVYARLGDTFSDEVTQPVGIEL